MRPARETTVKATAGWRAYLATTAAMITVMGPVGPDTCAGVPPKSAAKKPTTMAARSRACHWQSPRLTGGLGLRSAARVLLVTHLPICRQALQRLHTVLLSHSSGAELALRKPVRTELCSSVGASRGDAGEHCQVFSLPACGATRLRRCQRPEPGVSPRLQLSIRQRGPLSHQRCSSRAPGVLLLSQTWTPALLTLLSWQP